MPELDHTINALIRKRAEIAGQIECHQDTLNQLIVDLDNVDHTLRLFAPDIDLEEIEPKPVPPRNQAFKGEMKRLIIDALKRAGGEALNSRDIADLVMQHRGLGTNNLRLRVTMGKRVCAALTSMRRRGLLVSEKEGKGLQRWRLRP
jgi:hypothetical protein